MSLVMVVRERWCCAGWCSRLGSSNSRMSIASWRQRDASRVALGIGVWNNTSPVYWSCDSGRRHVGLAASAS